MKPVTVAIITTKYHPVTELCIESVLKHRKDEKVVLICNGAEDVSWPVDYIRGMSKRYNIPVHVIGSSGVAAAYNHAIDISGTDDLVIVQNDVIVTPNWLEPLQKLAYSHKDIGMVAPFTFPQWPMNHKPFPAALWTILKQWQSSIGM